MPDGAEDAEIAKRLRHYWRRNRLSTRTVSAGFRSPKVSIKNFQFPAMPDSELSSALRLEATELLALDEALQELEARDPRMGRIVECRFFGGLSVLETVVPLIEISRKAR